MNEAIKESLSDSSGDCPVEIKNARQVLISFLDQKQTHIDRAEIVSYAYLDAWINHFPLKSSDVDQKIHRLCCRIYQNEKDRFFKQRRMALAHLAQITKDI